MAIHEGLGVGVWEIEWSEWMTNELVALFGLVGYFFHPTKAIREVESSNSADLTDSSLVLCLLL